MTAYAASIGLFQEASVPHTPRDNSRAERANRVWGEWVGICYFI
jgi:hypothetical protein